MRKLYSMIALLALTCTVNAQKRLIKATTSGNWTSAATWTTTGSPGTPTNNDSIVIAAGVTVTVTTAGGGNTILVQNAVLDVFGTLVMNEPTGNSTNNLNISTTTSNIALPVIRVADNASISKGVDGNGSGRINVIVNGANTQLKYSTEPVAGVLAGQTAGPVVTGPAFAQNTYNQQPMYFTTGSNASLPVKISVFKAATSDKNVILSWVSQQEINTQQFVVEKSSNGSAWQPAGIVAAHGFSGIPISYQFTDEAASAINYYRLKMVDYDGKSSYSGTLVVRLKNTNVNVSVFPNPAVNTVNISVGQNLAQQGFTVRLLNQNGQLLVSRKIAEGSSVLSFDVSSFKTGNYTLDMLFAGGTREIHKLAIVK
ncbi:MAG: T9SS type A sorting domain-containing protein [Chitinophagaceae bacterium]